MEKVAHCERFFIELVQPSAFATNIVLLETLRFLLVCDTTLSLGARGHHLRIILYLLVQYKQRA